MHDEPLPRLTFFVELPTLTTEYGIGPSIDPDSYAA